MGEWYAVWPLLYVRLRRSISMLAMFGPVLQFKMSINASNVSKAEHNHHSVKQPLP